MKILIINSGSSSIKFQLLDMQDETVLASGLVERIGEKSCIDTNIKCVFRPGSEQEKKITNSIVISDHRQGMLLATELLTDKTGSVLADKSEISAVGHRVVHGGEAFHAPAIINEEVIKALEKMIPLAPLHNPAGLDGINVAKEFFDTVPHVAVFDTAFYQTIPAHAHIYAIPYELYTEYKVRRYGFHGTSHKFVAGEAAKVLNKPLSECNLITIHLGNGCSMTAVKDGLAVDTSMGVTPLEGLVMGTRSGDIDPAIFAFLHRNNEMSVEEIDHMLNKKSGLKGICEMNDMRDIHDAIEKGDQLAQLALDVQTYRIKKYIGSYMAVLGRVDAIIFTAGIGENDSIVRQKSLVGLEQFGIHLNPEKNDKRSKDALKINSEESKTEIWVIPTNEELAIARQTCDVITTK